MTNELYKSVVKFYGENNSIRETAAALNISIVKARRILITEGLWHSETSDKIGRLYRSGKSTEEIANILNVGKKNVQAYIPYSRGQYGSQETRDSIRSRLYRSKKKIKIIGSKSEKSDILKIDDLSDLIYARRLFIPSESSQIEFQKSVPYAPLSKGSYKLKLELVRKVSRYEYEHSVPLSIDGIKTLHKFAGVNKEISRTVLVPADMTLHNLNYLIQKAFGFQNRHLHSFSISGSDFKRITGRDFNQWKKYCGILFRADNNAADMFCDDDYNGSQSINTWLKSKYSKSTEYLCASDTYLYQRTFIEHFEDALSEDYNRLLERLKVGEVFVPGLKRIDTGFLHESIKRSLEHCKEKLQETDEKDLSLLKKAIVQYAELFNSENFDEIKNVLSDLIWPSVNVFNPVPEPFTSRINYNYEAGDGWTIRITCLDQSEEEIEIPKCIEADGKNLIEDCGSIKEYVKMLRIMNNEKNKNCREAKQSARFQGFTGRMSKPEHII